MAPEALHLDPEVISHFAERAMGPGPLEAKLWLYHNIAGNNGSNYIWQLALCSKPAHLHNTKVVANGFFGGNLIWQFI